MTTDLWMLVAAALLQWVLLMGSALPKIFIRGLPWAFGNRAGDAKPLPDWVGRLDRASDNLQENLILFAIVVLVVHATGSANETSATGAILFLGARVAHAVVYLAGIPVIRTLIWAVGVAGMFMVATALI